MALKHSNSKLHHQWIKKQKKFDSPDVCSQLLSAGVLEAVKIRKQGYSIRRTQEEFYSRYACLTPELYVNSKLKNIDKRTLSVCPQDHDRRKYKKKTFRFQDFLKWKNPLNCHLLPREHL
jgi:myosin heavy subunit